MLGSEEFAALLNVCGPFPPDRRVAVAVSGGPDSLALALLTAEWGHPLALVVDHGLRPESADEARLTVCRLAERGIAARLLTLRIEPGPRLAARARVARYAVLSEACAAAGLPQLLLGHHAGDQAETVLLRALHGSGPAGRAGMAAVQPADGICLLRPLLGVAPIRLRETLRNAGLDWIEDPSNRDLRAERSRLRALIDDAHGAGPRTLALGNAARHWARRRNEAAAQAADWLAAHALLHPGLYAELPDRPMQTAALSALIQSVTGAAYPPNPAATARLAAAPRPATLGGTRLLRARGRLFLAREAAAMQPAVPAYPGAVWDRRFQLHGPPLPGAHMAALGGDAAAWRRLADLPAAVLSTLPCLRRGGEILAIPHLGMGEPAWKLLPVTARPATRAPTPAPRYPRRRPG